MSSKSFTARQGQYLAFIDAYTRVHGRAPAETDMQRHFQLSPPSVHQMVLTLERLGHIRRQPGVAAASRCSSLPKICPFSVTPNQSNPLCRGTRPRSRLARRGGDHPMVLSSQAVRQLLTESGIENADVVAEDGQQALQSPED